MECRRIKFKDTPNGDTLLVYSDATPSRTQSLGQGTAAPLQDLPIMISETLAAIVGIYSAINAGSNSVHLNTDNMKTWAFLRRGPTRFLYNFNFNYHFLFVFSNCKLRHLVSLETIYINIFVNPADRLTRIC